VYLYRRQSKLLDGRPCSATWQRPIVWRRASRARHLSLLSRGNGRKLAL